MVKIIQIFLILIFVWKCLRKDKVKLKDNSEENISETIAEDLVICDILELL